MFYQHQLLKWNCRKKCRATDNRQDEYVEKVYRCRGEVTHVRANASATVAWNDPNFGARSSRCNVRFDRFTARPRSYGLSHPEMELLGACYIPTVDCLTLIFFHSGARFFTRTDRTSASCLASMNGAFPKQWAGL